RTIRAADHYRPPVPVALPYHDLRIPVPLAHQRHRAARIRLVTVRSDLYGEESTLLLRRLRRTHHLQRYRSHTVLEQPYLGRRRIREVDDPRRNIRAAIVDADQHRASIVEAPDPHERSEWKGLMRRGHLAHIVDLAARSQPSVKPRPIPARHSHFI